MFPPSPTQTRRCRSAVLPPGASIFMSSPTSSANRCPWSATTMMVLIPVSRRMRTHRRNWSSIVSISSRASLVSFSPNSSISCDVTSTS